MNKFLTFLTKIDQFGVPLRLRISEDQLFKTAFGGVFSFIVYSCSLAYGAYIFMMWLSGGFAPAIEDRVQTLTSDTQYNFDYSPIKTELGYFDTNHTIIKPLTSNKARYFQSYFNSQIGFDSHFSNSYKGSEQADCLSTFKITDAVCLDYKQTISPNKSRLNHIKTTKNGTSDENIVFTLSVCAGDKECEDKHKIKQFVDSNVIQLLQTITTMQYDPLLQEIVAVPRLFRFYLSNSSAIYIQVQTISYFKYTLQITEVHITTGVVFQNTKVHTIISDVQITTQSSKGGHQAGVELSGIYSISTLSLSKIKTVRVIQYIDLGNILAQVGSIISLLFFFQNLVVAINEMRLNERMIIEILKIYFPQLKNRNIQSSLLGKIIMIEGMSDVQKNKFVQQHRHGIIERLCILNLLQQIVTLQWAIYNIYPHEQLQLLKLQGMKLPEYQDDIIDQSVSKNLQQTNIQQLVKVEDVESIFNSSLIEEEQTPFDIMTQFSAKQVPLFGKREDLINQVKDKSVKLELLGSKILNNIIID